jgi:hypothetical protein
LERLSKIPDYRNPKKVKHKLTVVLIYGILIFVYQMASRREANRTMSRPAFPIAKTSRHAWLSSEPLKRNNVHERCNLGARHRWGIESGILVEKRHGYHYEHLFSHDWNAMKGFHYLMRLGHALNVLAQHSTALIKTVQKLGVRGFIDFVKSTMAGRWLEAKRVMQRLAAPFQLRLE